MIKSHIPCPCGKSSDAYTDYGDHGKCFSCGKGFKFNQMEPLDKVPEESRQIIPLRGINADTLRKYNVVTRVVEDNPVSVIFPYKAGAFEKFRLLNKKHFYSKGKHVPGLFGTESHGDKAGLK